MKTVIRGSLVALLCIGATVQAWNNGQTGNTTTTSATECRDPPYSTHDWIADHALALLPSDEQAWLVPYKALYLVATEAPDNKTIYSACHTPNRGYDDRAKGHSVEWNAGATAMLNDRPAVRAQEEYSKAVVAFQQGKPAEAAFYLGAMAHYIGDVSQYGHAWRDEQHHGDYESWVSKRTASFSGGTFDAAVSLDTLVRRTPRTAAMRVSHATFVGQGRILSAQTMDSLFASKPPEYVESIGASLNLGVNELADVLHTFYLNVVSEQP